MGKKIRCKVVCRSVEKFIEIWGDRTKALYTAKLCAVTGGSKENEEFWKHTPSGSIDFQTITSDVFEVGKDYFVDFTVAE